MTNIKNGATMKCYSRNVTYSIDDIVYLGTIQNLGNYGATIVACSPISISKGKMIYINMLSQNQIEVKCAEVAYADESSFGVKFV
jgi:hypothetical protein